MFCQNRIQTRRSGFREAYPNDIAAVDYWGVWTDDNICVEPSLSSFAQWVLPLTQSSAILRMHPSSDALAPAWMMEDHDGETGVLCSH